MILEKIISGGQTGADIAGVRAAHNMGLKVGGTMPRGFRIIDGFRPDWGMKFGFVEHPSPDYPPRTECNVQDSDATIRIAHNFQSRGESLTLKLIRKHGKPHFDVPVPNVRLRGTAPMSTPVHAARWLIENKVRVLNIAGNSEQTCPGIEWWAEQYVTDMIASLRQLTRNPEGRPERFV
jgi:hypothetical protein